MLWLALPLVVYVAANNRLDLVAVHHNADLVRFHALGAAAQMISEQIEWDEGRLRISIPPAALAVFAVPEAPVRD